MHSVCRPSGQRGAYSRHFVLLTRHPFPFSQEPSIGYSFLVAIFHILIGKRWSDNAPVLSPIVSQTQTLPPVISGFGVRCLTSFNLGLPSISCNHATERAHRALPETLWFPPGLPGETTQEEGQGAQEAVTAGPEADWH